MEHPSLKRELIFCWSKIMRVMSGLPGSLEDRQSSYALMIASNGRSAGAASPNGEICGLTASGLDPHSISIFP